MLSTIRQINALNATVTSVLGGLLNGLAIWAVLRHSGAELRVYKKVFVFGSVVDMLFVGSNLVTQRVRLLFVLRD